MTLNQGRWRHDHGPLGILAVEQTEHPGRLRRIALGHRELLAADQLVEGGRAEVDPGPGLGRQVRGVVVVPADRLGVNRRRTG